jgi:hypothetical protein
MSLDRKYSLSCKSDVSESNKFAIKCRLVSTSSIRSSSSLKVRAGRFLSRSETFCAVKSLLLKSLAYCLYLAASSKSSLSTASTFFLFTISISART